MTALLAERSLIRITGDDAVDFLQNLMTNDVKKLEAGALLYACLLTPQGRFLHDLFISRDGSGFLIECETSRREDLVRRLKFYKLRAKVTIEETVPDLKVYTASDKVPGGFQDPRLPALGYRAYLSNGTGSADFYRDRRIHLGVPEGSHDIKPETDTIAHVNLDCLNAVSWDKGCYVGQEITAMTENRGTVKKRMVIVSGRNLSAGTILTDGGQDVGEVRSVNSTGTEALALLKLASLKSSLAISGNADAVTARLPDWVRAENP